MRAGRLRHRISFYYPTKSSGVSGAETLTLFGTFPCDIEPMSGKEYQALGGTTNALTHKITMRYVHGLTDKHVGIWEGRRFRIQVPICPGERKREWQIIVVET